MEKPEKATWQSDSPETQKQLESILLRMRSGCVQKDRRWGGRTYKGVLNAKEVVDWLVEPGGICPGRRAEAVEIGQALQKRGMIEHVWCSKTFKFRDTELYFRYVDKKGEKGAGGSLGGSAFEVVSCGVSDLVGVYVQDKPCNGKPSFTKAGGVCFYYAGYWYLGRDTESFCYRAAYQKEEGDMLPPGTGWRTAPDAKEPVPDFRFGGSSPTISVLPASSSPRRSKSPAPRSPREETSRAGKSPRAEKPKSPREERSKSPRPEKLREDKPKSKVSPSAENPRSPREEKAKPQREKSPKAEKLREDKPKSKVSPRAETSKSPRDRKSNLQAEASRAKPKSPREEKPKPQEKSPRADKREDKPGSPVERSNRVEKSPRADKLRDEKLKPQVDKSPRSAEKSPREDRPRSSAREKSPRGDRPRSPAPEKSRSQAAPSPRDDKSRSQFAPASRAAKPGSPEWEHHRGPVPEEWKKIGFANLGTAEIPPELLK